MIALAYVGPLAVISAALIGSLGSLEIALGMGAILVFLARRASRHLGGGAPPRPPAVASGDDRARRR